MSDKIIELTCPGCGARVRSDQKECEWCHAPIVVSSFNSVNTMNLPKLKKYVKSYESALKDDETNQRINKSLGLCYLKLKLYDKAEKAFEVAIDDDMDDSEVYFYYSTSLLHGKKAFLSSRSVIDEILEYMDAAISIEPRGIYYYFVAYIKYDYFERKYLNTSPDYHYYLSSSQKYGTSAADKQTLSEILNVSLPSAIN